MLARELAVVVCLRLCVCVSVCHTPVMYCIETAARIELLFACRFPSTYATLCVKNISVSPKTMVLPRGSLS